MTPVAALSQLSKKPLLELEEALAKLIAAARPLGKTETVNTFDADGRVLAQDVVSPLDVPGFDNSQMDGYAVRAVDVRSVAIELPVSQRIAAGHFGAELLSGTAARIFTGAPMPVGADAVLMQEDCTVLPNGRIRVNVAAQLGQWVRQRGEDIAVGQIVLRMGERLGPASAGLCASMGMHELRVAARVRVAMFSTGDELVMPGTVAPHDLPLGSIYNSNRYFLRAMLQRLGCDVTDLGIVPDNRAATVRALEQAALANDVIVTSGGVSVGEEDHIKPAVEQLGSLDLWQISMKPGKPFAYGRLGQCHFVGLPGNPVSSWVTFALLVRPLLLALQGAIQIELKKSALKAHGSWTKRDKRREFLRAKRMPDGSVAIYENQNSSVLSSVVWADGLVDNPPNTAINTGDWVQFLPLAELMN